MLTTEDEAKIEAIVRRVLASPAGATAQWLPRRLTAEEFAACLEVHPETVRRYLRGNERGIVRKKLAIQQGQAWRIDIGALPLFGVTPAVASARLAQFQAAAALPVPQRAPAAAPESVSPQPR